MVYSVVVHYTITLNSMFIIWRPRQKKKSQVLRLNKTQTVYTKKF